MAEKTDITNKFEGTAETEQIREQIEETRQEITETIEAIQEKLSFPHLTEKISEEITEQVSNVYHQAKEKIIDVTLVKTVKAINTVNNELNKSKIYHKISENPLPLFLGALGLGLLLFRNSGKKKNYQNKYKKLSSDGSSSIVGKLNQTANSAYQTLSENAEAVYEKVNQTADNTYRTIEELGASTQERFEYNIEVKPLAVGAVAFAAGVSLGLMFPSTSYEEKIFGESGRNFLNKVQDKTVETLSSTFKDLAGTVYDKFQEETPKSKTV
ncbi:MAG: DUF3618 domain-containing protein [Pyrinomonadaceae bacterium]|nr:DUF3618 domain-containing protein [Pyrinomonadaceae bacterium]